MAVPDATGAVVGSEFLEQLVKSKKLLTDPSVAGERKAVSENQHRLQGDPQPLTTNPDPDPDPDPDPMVIQGGTLRSGCS